MLNVMTSSVWRHTDPWRRRSYDHSTRRCRLPVCPR